MNECVGEVFLSLDLTGFNRWRRTIDSNECKIFCIGLDGRERISLPKSLAFRVNLKILVNFAYFLSDSLPRIAQHLFDCANQLCSILRLIFAYPGAKSAHFHLLNSPNIPPIILPFKLFLNWPNSVHKVECQGRALPNALLPSKNEFHHL